jgi:DNA-binding transcriptional regulator YdaS (Cro superfamily)
MGKVSRMKQLLELLNSISEQQRNTIALSCGTSVGYLRKACSTGQKLGPALCVALERATGGVVTRQALRPDDWAAIWPELEKVSA